MQSDGYIREGMCQVIRKYTYFYLKRHNYSVELINRLFDSEARNTSFLSNFNVYTQKIAIYVYNLKTSKIIFYFTN